VPGAAPEAEKEKPVFLKASVSEGGGGRNRTVFKHDIQKLSTCLFPNCLSEDHRNGTNQQSPWLDGLKQPSQPSVAASYVCFMSAAAHANRRICTAALITA